MRSRRRHPLRSGAPAVLPAALALVLLAALVGGGQPARAASEGGGTAVEPLCTVDDERLPEPSGLAAAPDGRLFTHNDSGSDPRLVVLDRSCSLVAAPSLDVPWEDVEDLARAPGPGGAPALWLADVGDNQRERDEVEVDRVLEPQAPYPTELDVDRLRLRLPDGPADSEVLLVAPDGAALALVEKTLASSTSRVWVAEAPRPGEVTDLQQVGVVQLPAAALGPPAWALTGGDVHPDGTAVVLRTYVTAWVWSLPTGGGFGRRLAEAFAAEPVQVPLPLSVQGEAIAWTPDGDGLLTVPEGPPQPLHEVPLTDEARALVRGDAAPRPPAAGPVEELTEDVDGGGLLLAGGAVLAAAAAVLAALLVARGRRTGRDGPGHGDVP